MIRLCSLQGFLHWPSNPSAFPAYRGGFKKGVKHGEGVEGNPPRNVVYRNGCIVSVQNKPPMTGESEATVAVPGMGMRGRDAVYAGDAVSAGEGVSRGSILKGSTAGGRASTTKTGGGGDGGGISRGGASSRAGGSSYVGSPGGGKYEDDDEEEDDGEDGDGEEEGDGDWGRREDDGDGDDGQDVDWGEGSVEKLHLDDNSEFIGAAVNGKPNGLGSLLYSRYRDALKSCAHDPFDCLCGCINCLINSPLPLLLPLRLSSITPKYTIPKTESLSTNPVQSRTAHCSRLSTLACTLMIAFLHSLAQSSAISATSSSPFPPQCH